MLIPGVECQDLGQHKCGIVTFTYKGKTADEIKQHLATKKINVSISLQEYARLDMAARNLNAIIRSSLHYYNTEKEIDVLCEVLSSLSKF